MKLLLKKISPEKIHNFLSNYYPWILIIIFVLLICFNALIYYQYVYLSVKADLEPRGEEIAIDQEILQKVLDNVNLREDNLLRVQQKKYYSPFE